MAALTLLLAPAMVVSQDRPAGYLAKGELDVAYILEPAPRPCDPRYETDRKIFRATRALVGTPRWTLAIGDAEYGVPALLKDYSCVVCVTLTEANAPKLVQLVRRAGIDTGTQTNLAKQNYRRERPFTIDRGTIRQPRSDLYDNARRRINYDYHSGHTTWEWTWALVLAGPAPDRAQQILERGRAYGDSRFICGAHNESAVEVGMLSATAAMTLVQTKAAYQADQAAARRELDTLRASGQHPSGCDVEAGLLRERVILNSRQNRSCHRAQSKWYAVSPASNRAFAMIV